MATKQVIQIELTTDNWRTIRLNALIAYIAGIEELDIKRLEVKEVRKRK